MKICLILVDGMRPDSLKNIAEAQEIMSEAQYTMTAQTVYPSVTLPCHISLFHSIDPERHGTVTNIYAPQVRPIDGLFERLKQSGKASALFYDWEEIRDVSRPNSLKFAQFTAGRVMGYETTNDLLTEKLIETLKNGEYDFAFQYMGLTDWAGHKYGWMSEEYLAAMKQCWQNIKKIKNALEDDYMFIVTADHGGHDRGHGSDCKEDMTIPMFFFGNNKGNEFDFTEANIKDIAPTVAKLFGICPDEDWEGKSLI